MKVIIIKDKPNVRFEELIDEVKNNYDGIVMSANHNSKVDELINNVQNIKKELLSEIEKINQNLNNSMFNDLLNTLDKKKGNELVFIYINNEDHIKILEEKYQTITVNKDFIFGDIHEYNKKDKAMTLISELV